ncbi:auxin efflux carrier, partial [Mrakia frigida]|uniref:auxin efflux carrier n=1 Tax=Mrakia frigida TaxID=29902 RepID=UPI003FCC26F8
VPLLKIALVTLAGFTLTKVGLFPLAASRGFSQNLALPALVWASILPSFNSDNVSSIGPLLLTAFFYEVLGLFLAFLIREFFFVPREFQWGILIMVTLSNWGNLPTAIVQSVAAAAPFDPATDPALGTGYVAVFILAYNLTFFTGLYRVCGWDFLDESEEGPPETLRAKWSRRRRWINEKMGRKNPLGASDGGRELEEASTESEEAGPVEPIELQPMHKSRRASSGQQQLAAMDRLTRTASAATVDSVLERTSSYLPPSNGSTVTRRVLQSFRNHPHSHSHKERLPPPPPSANPSRAASPHGSNPDEEEDLDLPTEPQSLGITILHALKAILLSLCTPITGTLVLAIIFSLVSPLKALFVPDVPGWSGTRIRLAPDGRPPLAFIQDTATFVGDMCVPGSTILLGASFARIEIPKPFSKLPIGAIIAMTVVKMVILPVVGVLFVTGLSTSFYPPESKILNFVAMLLSGTPAAINQLVVTQLVAPGGRCDVVAAFVSIPSPRRALADSSLSPLSLFFRPDTHRFLLLQYIFMIISTTGKYILSMSPLKNPPWQTLTFSPLPLFFVLLSALTAIALSIVE